VKTDTPHPKGLVYIVGNDAAERFSYYGMKSILVVFMTTHLVTRSGEPNVMSPADAAFWYHMFGVGNYVFPILGALLADIVWGKYRTIVVLSLVYCLGHGVLALDSTRLGLGIGLSLIALGAGGIKPCVSAHLGDQYRGQEDGRISFGYSFFYFAINVGALLSTLFIPWVLAQYGPHTAFALPGVLMGVATLVFWIGRHTYTRVAPTSWKTYRQVFFGRDNLLTWRNLSLFYLLLSTFWAVFDQIGSSWVLQAERMERVVRLPYLGSFEVLSSQVQAINPLLILILTPLFAFKIYPWCERRGHFGTPTRLWLGMVLAGVSFLIVGVAQMRINNGESVSMLWQVCAYVFLTIAEVLVSVTALQLAYTQAPRASASLVTSLYLISVAFGNLWTALYNGSLAALLGGPETARYYLFFAVLPIVASLAVRWTVRSLESQQPLRSVQS
jgi:POT family proton-dependent oligopeptide transporter